MATKYERVNRPVLGFRTVDLFHDFRSKLFQLRIRTSKMDAFSTHFKIILGSSSSARREVLAKMGYEFTILLAADIDEKSIRKEKPEDLVMALSEAKAEAIVEKLSNDQLKKDANVTTLLITCDQVGTTDSVMGLPSALTAKLIKEVSSED